MRCSADRGWPSSRGSRGSAAHARRRSAVSVRDDDSGAGARDRRRSREALPHARPATQLDPEALICHWVRGQVAHWAGERDEAMAAFSRACDVSNRSTYPLASQAAACATWGLQSEALALHQELLAKRALGFVACGPLAISAAAVGDMHAAAEFMEQSCDEREPVLMVYFREYFDWQPLRNHPRSADVRRRWPSPMIFARSAMRRVTAQPPG